MSNHVPLNPTSSYQHKQLDLEGGYTNFHYPPAPLKLHEADKYIRLEFIRRVYILLSLQLLITWAVTYFVYKSPTATNYVNTHTAPLYTSIIGTFVFLFMAFCFGKQHPHGLLILLGFTLCEAYSVAFIAIHYTASSVLLGCGITASVFIGLTVYTLYTKSDFNYLGAALASALWIMIIGGFMQWLFFPNDSFARIGLACLGAAVACGYILYDTSEIMYRSTPDDVVIACLNLYIDIIMLFIKILELVGKKRD